MEQEEISRSTKVPQHPVEKGLPLTDNVRTEPLTLSISGKIVNTDKQQASDIIAKLDKLRKEGSTINYIGRNIANNFLIQSFHTSHPNTNWGGADFDMELIEARFAKSAFDPSKQKKSPNTTNNVTLKEGAIVKFKGGAVYVSSDAKKAAANRGSSTCKITKISLKSWSIHQYHLISTDGGRVYGWVDKANIEGTGTGGKDSTNTNAETNAGTQRTKESVAEGLIAKGDFLMANALVPKVQKEQKTKQDMLRKKLG